MEKLFYSTGKIPNLRRKKEETEDRGNVMLECLKFVAGKWNPHDTFPEEKGYYTPIEVLEFLQTLIRD